MRDFENLAKGYVVNSFEELDPWYAKQIKKVTKIFGALAPHLYATEKWPRSLTRARKHLFLMIVA